MPMFTRGNTMGLHPGVTRSGINEKSHGFQTVKTWLEGKRRRDGAEGLWRIHDNLYDLSEWAARHPGGKHWLETTKEETRSHRHGGIFQGTDITEAFESNHLSARADRLLPRFFARKAKTPRHSLITFHETGFYKTLKRRLRENEAAATGPQQESAVFADLLAAGVFATALLGVIWTWWFLLASGALLASLSVTAHNFFHMRNNWRMYYFCLSLMSLGEWRVSHVLSHHLYPNTELDLEVTMLQPICNFLPRADKRLGRLAWALSPFVMICMSHFQFFRRLWMFFQAGCGGTSDNELCLREEMIGLSLPAFLFLFGGHGFWTTVAAWNAVIAMSSLAFGFVGLTAAHHHPDIYHDGDFLGSDRDFGVLQVAAARSKADLDAGFLVSMVTFGRHVLHHLFPTVDHSRLQTYAPILEETCREFDIGLPPFTAKQLIIGMYLQMARTRTNAALAIRNRSGEERRRN